MGTDRTISKKVAAVVARAEATAAATAAQTDAASVASVHEVRLTERDGPVGRLRAAVMKVDKDNPAPEDLAHLRVVLRAEPDLARELFDLAALTSAEVIRSILPRAPLGCEAISARADTMRVGLGSATAPEIERGLIEHVVLCWLRLQAVESRYTYAMGQSQELAWAYWWERRLTAAQGRYMRACECLARVRRLAGPSAVQINVGDQQVNVAGRVIVE